MARTRSIFFRPIQSLLTVISSIYLWVAFFFQVGIKRLRRWRRKNIIRSVLALITTLLCIFVFPVWTTAFSVNNAGLTASSPSTNLIQRGQTLYKAGKFSQALEVWQEAIAALKASGDKLRQAMTLSNLSLAYQQLGEWQKAQQAIIESLNLLQDEQNLPFPERNQILAQTLNIRGRWELAQGQSQAALTTWQETTEIYTLLDDETGILRSRINQAQAMQALGLYRQAQKTLTEVQQTLSNQPDSSLKTLGLRSLGNVLRVVGDLQTSREVLEQSLAAAQASQSPQAISEAFLALANTARAQQDFQAAVKFYQQAANSSLTSITRLQAQLNQLSLLVEENKELNNISRLWSQISSEIADLPPSRPAVYAQINLAQSLMKMTSRKEAQVQDITSILARAVQQSRNLGDRRATSSALGTLGELYEQTQQWQYAVDLTQQALFLAQTIDAPELTYRWQWQLGRLQKQQGNIREATAAYDEAVTTLQSIRRDLVAINPDVQFSFREEVEPVYRQLVDLLLQPQGNTEPSQENLQKARYTIESLQLAELDNYFREPCLEPLREIDLVDKQAAIFYTIMLGERLEVIISLPEQDLRHYTAKVSSQEVESILQSLQQNLILPYTSESEILPLSQKLYNWLIQPVESTLTENQIETLVFVLDGSFRNVPMTVLHDGKQYLVEKYNIALTQSLQLFEPKPLTEITLEALSAGLTQERFGFAPLQYVAQEITQIESQLPSEVLLDREFTSTNLDNEVKSTATPILHFATHGQFSSQAEDTFILAWDEPINVNELDNLLRTREESVTSTLELLVLSACETAKGDDRATLGLAGVAIRAGARSTLASLWLVDDESTALLMSEFYQKLKTGINKAEALRQAQLSLLQGKYQHPRFWSAFILLGNWL